MTTTTIAGRTLERDAEGYLKNAQEWDRDVAQGLADEAGLGVLTERHFQVIEYMRNRFLESGTAPSIRTLGKESGVSIKELYQLFPKGPAKLAAKLGGIPKPRGCI